MKSRRMYIIVGAAVILFGGAIAVKIIKGDPAGDARRASTPAVTVQLPIRETVKYKLRFTGDVLPIQQANIYSKVAGNLEKVFVNIGAAVREDQMLALIDTTVLAQQYEQASATYHNAKTIYDRTKMLWERNLIAKQDLDNAEASMKAAKANNDLALTTLNYARITAPFSGIITKRYLDPGVAMKANDAVIFTIMDLDAMKIMVNVLEKDIPRVVVGTRAVITVDAFPGKEFTGSITRLSEAVDLATRTMAVEIDVPNHDHMLKPGMFANIVLVVGEHPNAVTIPTSSLAKDDRGTFVFVVQEGKAHRKDITLGIEQDGRTEILSGLAGNEQIVSAGQQLLKDGSAVMVEQ